MSLPHRLEQVGIVVGSVIMLPLPFIALLDLFIVSPHWVGTFLVCIPGLVVGVLVALDLLPVSYGQVWLFSLASSVAIGVLWAGLEISLTPANRPTALATWVIALAIGAFVAWAKPHLQFRRNGA
ncbi:MULTISPECIES: hypothetical protein [unclassified Haladaptatus]|uniref:hypothetical protein n=1 Tax=unclassified Haladaptatus TaxID=2622732 RepID=UPI00209C5A24|nr:MULTISPECIES: hypothetical protein [unclassified Haladaptatus]MCO8246835.1 hypothetical protein [Haladaptatus sp. AB643]MCO8253639.1 hypothetical protein [Haladaptatus sp. AB618]